MILSSILHLYTAFTDGERHLTISRAAAKLAAVVKFGDLISFLKVFLLCSPSRIISQEPLSVRM